VQLNVANRVVYEAHDYGFWYSNLTQTSYANAIAKNWGYLVTGSNPQPVWIGEFGTCNTSTTCVSSTNDADPGFWFGLVTSYIQTHNLDWSYWAINGTESTGTGRTYGATETYGVLNAAWSGTSLPALTTALQGIMTH
jgi:endoglucanase